MSGLRVTLYWEMQPQGSSSEGRDAHTGWCLVMRPWLTGTRQVTQPLETSSARLSKKKKEKERRTERNVSEQPAQGRDGERTYPLTTSAVLSPMVKAHLGSVIALGSSGLTRPFGSSW